MTDETSEPRPKRKYTRRAPVTGTAGTRRRRAATGNELVDNLDVMIGELIKENRKLKRQVEKLSAGATGAASSGVEKGLKSIQRKVQRAMAAATPTRRRRTSTSTSTTPRRRGRPPKSESAS